MVDLMDKWLQTLTCMAHNDTISPTLTKVKPNENVTDKNKTSLAPQLFLVTHTSF